MLVTGTSTPRLSRRAMAVSLSLMFGRLGSIVGNLMFGSLLETACPATFYALGAVLIGNVMSAPVSDD